MVVIRMTMLLFGVLFLYGNTWGQFRSLPDTVLFSGIVIHRETARPLPDVTCRYGEREGTVSDASGRFCIRTVRGDTLRFSHVGFKTYLTVVPDTLFEPDYMMGIFLSPDTLLLSEVLIVKRWKPSVSQAWKTAHNNMAGILRHAYAPVQHMDAGMNQRMMIEEYARSIEMKGHVDVRAGVGTQSLEAYKLLRLGKKLRDEKEWLDYGEIDLLKSLFYAKKSENTDN